MRIKFFAILVFINTSFAEVTLKHDSRVSGIAFSSDSQYLAAICERAVYIWNAQTGDNESVLKHDFTVSPIYSDPEHENLEPQLMPVTINAVAFGKDGKQILTSCNDYVVRVWDIEKKSILHEFKHDSRIKAIAFSSDGCWVIRISGHKVYASNTTTKEKLELPCPNSVSAMVLDDSGEYIIATAEKTAYVWKLPTGEQQATFKHEGSILAFAYNSKKNLAASSSLDITQKEKRLEGNSYTKNEEVYTCKVWSILDGRLIHSLEDMEGSIYAIAFSADGKRLMTASGFTAGIWDVETEALVTQKMHSDRLSTPLSLSSKGEFFVTAPWVNSFFPVERSVTLWNIETNKSRAFFKNESVRVVAISPNDELLAAVSKNRTVKVRRLGGSPLLQGLEKR